LLLFILIKINNNKKQAFVAEAAQQSVGLAAPNAPPEPAQPVDFVVVYLQSYKIKLPSQAFLDERFSPWTKLRQVGCYDLAKVRLVTIDSCALIHSCLSFAIATS